MRPILLKTRNPIRIESSESGFTLIELMVVLVIVGIITAIAVPAYTSSVQNSRRTDAKNALLDLASREEKFFSQNNAYTASISTLYPGSTATGSSVAVESGSNPYYTLSVSVTSPSATAVAAFSATAAPNSGTSQYTDVCGTFTINNFGVTGNTVTSGTAPSNCW